LEKRIELEKKVEIERVFYHEWIEKLTRLESEFNEPREKLISALGLNEKKGGLIRGLFNRNDGVNKLFNRRSYRKSTTKSTSSGGSEEPTTETTDQPPSSKPISCFQHFFSKQL
jgi:hypothetical protein